MHLRCAKRSKFLVGLAMSQCPDLPRCLFSDRYMGLEVMKNSDNDGESPF